MHQVIAPSASELAAVHTNLGGKLQVLVDLDSIARDLMTPWLARYNADYNDTATPDRFRCWDMPKYLKPECGSNIYTYLKDPELYRSAPPMPGLRENLPILCEIADVVVVTHCVPFAMTASALWVKEHMPEVTKAAFLWTALDKHHVAGDVIFDDKPKTLQDFYGYRAAIPYAYNLHIPGVRYFESDTAWWEFTAWVWQLSVIEAEAHRLVRMDARV